MAIDRGGLQYRISVRDSFSRGIRRFREELVRARRSFREFRRDVERAGTGQTQVATSIRRTRVELQKLQTVQAQSSGTSRATSAQQVQDARRIRRGIGRVVSELKKQSAELALIRKQWNATGRAAQRAGLAARTSARRGARGVRRLNKELKTTESTANRVAFTFRRLFGILAAFTIARELLSGFRNLVVSGVSFNAEIEQSQLGLAGILTATADITDGQGQLVKGAQAFSLALGEASRQQELLRTDALRTTATFQELLAVFQVALGPGLAQGLKVDEIRTLSVLVSQAASAIGLAQNQLSEEIRALLTGQIRARTTRIAQVLALTNEDIRNAREQGQLFEFLQERLAGFDLAARRAARTIPGFLARIRDAFGLVSGRAALEFTDEVERSLEGIFDLLTREIRTEEGRTILTPNPAVVKVFQGIFDALTRIVRVARDLLARTGLEPFVATARLLSRVLEIVGILIVDIGIGAARAFAQVQAVLGPILSIISAILGSSSDVNSAFNEVVATLAQIVTLIAAVRIATLAWAGAVKLVRAGVAFIATLRALISATKAIEGGFLAINSTLLVLRANGLAAVATFVALPAILAGIIALVFRLAEEAAGVSLKFETIVKIIGVLLQTALQNVVTSFQVSFNAVLIVVNKVLSVITTGLSKLLDVASAISGTFSPELSGKIAAAAVDLEFAAVSFTRAAAGFGTEVDEGVEKLSNTGAEFTKALNDVLSGAGADRTLGEFVTDFSQDVSAAITKLFGAVQKSTKDAQNAADKANFVGRSRALTEEDRKRTLQLEQQADLLQLQAAGQARLLQLTQARVSSAELAAQRLRNTINLEQERAQQRIANLDVEIAKLNQAADAEQKGSVLRNSLLERAALLEAQKAAQVGLTNTNLELQREKLELLEERARGLIDEGLGRGLLNFVDQFGNAFEAGVRIAEGLVNRLATFLTTVLTDFLTAMFDPENKTAFKERLGLFLQDIGKLIIDQLIKLLIATAIAKAFGVPLPGDPTPPPSVSLAEGGTVPGAHQLTPPPGVAKSDTVRAWLEPKEFVHPVSAVKNYGLEVMESIRKGLINPAALKALAGVGKMRSLRAVAHRGPGFQEGGLVSDQLSIANELAATADVAEDTAAGQPSQAFLVSNDQMMGTLLAGGKKAFRRFLRDNAQDFDGILRGGRTGG